MKKFLLALLLLPASFALAEAPVADPAPVVAPKKVTPAVKSTAPKPTVNPFLPKVTPKQVPSSPKIVPPTEAPKEVAPVKQVTMEGKPVMLAQNQVIKLSNGMVLTNGQATPLPPADFLAQVIDAIKKLGGMTTMLKISTIILLLIASMKVSVLNTYVWSKLGEAQVWVAPFLGLLAGLLGLGAGGVPITTAVVFAYVTAGGGAVFLHELLDSLKAVPGLGAVYLKAIEIAERVLGGGDKPQEAPKV